MAGSTIPLARAIAALAIEQARLPEEVTRHTLEAYAWIAGQPQGQVILEDLAQRLIRVGQGPHDEGARRLVLLIFERVADGLRLQREG